MSSGCARDRDLAQGATCLVDAGRPFDAASLLTHEKRVTRSLVPARVIADVLRAIVSAAGECDTPNPQLAGDIASLLDMLAEADYDSKDLARLEWGLLPHVSRQERPTGALHEILAEDAALANPARRGQRQGQSPPAARVDCGGPGRSRGRQTAPGRPGRRWTDVERESSWPGWIVALRRCP